MKPPMYPQLLCGAVLKVLAAALPAQAEEKYDILLKDAGKGDTFLVEKKE